MFCDVLSKTLFLHFDCVVLMVFVNVCVVGMGNKKISLCLKAKLRGTVMICLTEKAEKWPRRGVVSSPPVGVVGSRPYEAIVTKAAPINVIKPENVESEDST